MRLPPAAPEVVAAAPPAWFPWLGTGVGLLLGVVGLVALVRTVPRLRRARTTTGTVVQVRRDTATRGQFRWRLLLELPVGQGGPVRAWWTGQSSLDHTAYAPGMRLPVRYDPVTGSVVDLPGGRRPPALLVPVALLVVGPLVAALFWALTA